MSGQPEEGTEPEQSEDSTTDLDLSTETPHAGEIVIDTTSLDITNEPVASGQVPLKFMAPTMTHQLRRKTLNIMVGLVTLALLIIVVGLALHWFDSDFAKTLLQTVVSPLLGALAAVVGYLFAERKE